MKNIEARIIRDYQVPSLVLMERAALSVTEVIRSRFRREETGKILVLCGSGNNGGDGFAIARILFLEGWNVEICFLGKEEKMTPECRLQSEICQNFHVPRVSFPEELSYALIVDAIFGIGLTREISGPLKSVIERVNECTAFKIAVDLPSGIHGDTGAVMGEAISCDVTVTFGLTKAGMCFYPGRRFCGEILLREIGILDLKDESSIGAVEMSDLETLPSRLPEGNKGTFGKVLIVGGSPGMAGAVYLSALAAFHTGVGMVRIHTDEANRLPLQTLLPEAIIETDFSEETCKKVLKWCDVVVLGPGLSQTQESLTRFRWYLRNCRISKKQLILDADGLNLLAAHPEDQEYLAVNVVCTPHLGEFSRLTRKSIPALKENLLSEVRTFASSTGCVLVCKDAATLIADPCCSFDKTFVNLSGNSGMAVAGSGDCLTGILAGVACMFRQEPLTAKMAVKYPRGYLTARKAALGVYLHGKAGEFASNEKGMHGVLASDIARSVSLVLKQIPFSS